MEQVYKERIGLWVDALRSGRFDQTTGLLGRPGPDGGKDQMCCLGVACEVAMEAGLAVERKLVEGALLKPRFEYGSEDDADDQELPRSVMRWFGFSQANPLLRAKSRLVCVAHTAEAGDWVGAAGCNDAYQLTLPQIAELVEATYLSDDIEGGTNDTESAEHSPVG